MIKRTIFVSLAALALYLSATAFAASGFRVWGTAWHKPPAGSTYSVLSHGIAAQKAHLYIYLDRQPCKAAWKSEAARFTSFKAGESHFQATGHAVVSMWVSGHFSKAFNAVAGTKAEPEYACSYLTTPDSNGHFTVTAAHRSNAYFVTG